MTVKVEVKAGGMPHNNIMALGLIGSLVCVYLTYLNQLGNTQVFSFFGALAVVFAIVWGSNAIKVLCSYGIGTGVPSAGMMSLGSGVIAMLLATRYGIAAPIVAVIVAGIIGAILGYIANNVLSMHIPVMIRSITELAIVGALTLMGFAALATGSFTLTPLMSGAAGFSSSFIGASIIAVAFMLGGIAIQHPFNATLGPNWEQDRMLMLAAECVFLSAVMMAIISFAFVGMMAAIISLIVTVVGWVYTYMQFIALSKRDAAAWLDAKPIVEPEVA
ncbi:MAG: tetrahydromethanopterin S-methyltransferase subunit C [Methanomicrobiales archaeon]|nr:tetrahydromethanopterin S-methyltransferase subunit C [Methanomicrobiales archaeon]